jgi:hypothetical protein
VLPDLVWDRMETDGIVEDAACAVQGAQAAALVDGKRADLEVVRAVPAQADGRGAGLHDDRPVTVAKDKKARARSIQGRMRMHKVHFPVFAPWWPARTTSF